MEKLITFIINKNFPKGDSIVKIIDIKMYKRGNDNMNTETLIKDLSINPAKNYTIEQSEDLARRVLRDCEFNHIIAATPIVKIANCFGFSCLKAENMPDDISGNIFVGGATKSIYKSDKIIIVGYNEEYEHQRFIIAHELAHYLIDYLGSNESKNPNILFTRTYPKKNHHSDEEVRADRFAAELLMPSDIFQEKYFKAMEASDYNRKYTILYLANFFQTKKSSIKRRIDEVIL